MPSRVIRGEINASESLSRVSMQADLTFRALLVAADDYGRLDGRPAMLKAVLFPTRDEVAPDQILGWLNELAEEGCVTLYTVKGRPYVALTSWEEHRGNGRRASKSRFPEPETGEIHHAETESPASEKSEISRGSARLTRDEGRGTLDGGRRDSRREATPPESDPPPKPKTPKPEPPEAVSFAEDFATALRAVHDRPKVPDDLRPWARSARLMVERDQRTWDELREVCRWLFDATSPSEDAAFWRERVVFSVPKFREKYDQIRSQHAREKAGGPRRQQPQQGNSNLGNWAREHIRRKAAGDA